jgi:hypothetical protein
MTYNFILFCSTVINAEFYFMPILIFAYVRFMMKFTINYVWNCNMHPTLWRQFHFNTIVSRTEWSWLYNDEIQRFSLLCIKCKIIWGRVKCYIFCNITPCSWMKDNRRFGGQCRHHLQGWRVSQAKSHHEASCCMLHGGSLLGLLIDPEGGGDMFYRNVHWFHWATRHYSSFFRYWLNSLENKTWRWNNNSTDFIITHDCDNYLRELGFS